MSTPIIAAPVGEPHVMAFTADVAPDSKAIAIPCDLVEGAEVGQCIQVVSDHCAAHGGHMVLGWAIWEWPGAFIEAEYHAAWANPTGELIDIAPRRDGAYRTITFLPDARLTDTGKKIDNIRRPLVNDRDVKQFLFLAQRQTEIFNHPSVTEQRDDFDPSRLPKALIKELLDLFKKQDRLQQRLLQRYPGG
ncbi:hypothetical protein [Chitinolyticbacter meiyuanensis]|uniref:hypothetical protein n=1 Tax=Chitinolyticbacter meiyuanensis TaxID=682798 RepID=UPI0011E5BFD7|nr:hypothetical protein [Chitinolyticbacter meiyuanensis]